MNIDPNTNLPELPEGYFWRITRWTSESSQWDLQVKIRKRLLGGLLSWGVASTLTRSTVWSIQQDAKQLADKFHERHNRLPGRKQFVGDYPPKRLGQS